MAKPLGVGIIGIGFMGSTHFRIFKNHPLAEIKAIADLDERKLQGDWSSIVGNVGDADNSRIQDLAGIKGYQRSMDLIQDDAVDLVDICLPTYLHKQHIQEAFKAGKHVFCEKPIARNLEEAVEIVSLARHSNLFFTVGMCVRYWPEYRHAYELFASGALGKVKAATFRRISPNLDGNAWENWFMKDALSGGALLDLHLHDTDAIRMFFGRPKSVTSFGLRGFRSDSGIDHIVTRYHYGEDSLIIGEGSWVSAAATPFEMSFIIVCEKGTIRLSETGYALIWEDGRVEKPETTDDAPPTGWHLEIDHVLRSILSQKTGSDFLSFDEMLDSIAIVEAEGRSIDRNEPVTIQYPQI